MLSCLLMVFSTWSFCMKWVSVKTPKKVLYVYVCFLFSSLVPLPMAAQCLWHNSKICVFVAAERFPRRGERVSLSSQVGEPPLFDRPLCLEIAWCVRKLSARYMVYLTYYQLSNPGATFVSSGRFFDTAVSISVLIDCVMLLWLWCQDGDCNNFTVFVPAVRRVIAVLILWLRRWCVFMVPPCSFPDESDGSSGSQEAAGAGDAARCDRTVECEPSRSVRTIRAEWGESRRTVCLATAHRNTTRFDMFEFWAGWGEFAFR